MPAKSPDELQKHTLNLYKGEFDELSRLYPDIGASEVIRRLVHAHIESKRIQPDELPKVSVSI